MLVDLLLTDKRFYTFEGYASRHVGHALNERGISCRMVDLSGGMLHAYFSSLQETSPSWTLSFANLTPHRKPLCDVVSIPHFYWVEGSPASALHFVHSSHGRLGLSDAALCQRLSSAHVLFLPPGIEKMPSSTKNFEVVLFADVIELPLLEKTWHENFESSAIEALRQAVSGRDPLLAGIQFADAEQYLNAQKTLNALSALQGVKIDVFGEHAGRDWLVRLPQSVYLHSQLPYTEHFEVLKRSAIAIAEPSSPWYWRAIAAGCLPLPPDKEQISHYLARPQERAFEIERLGQALPQMTWEKQVEKLIQVMPC